MVRLQAYKYELSPNGEQQRHMRRFVFNQALALQQAHHASGGKFIGYFAIAKRFASIQTDARSANTHSDNGNRH